MNPITTEVLEAASLLNRQRIGLDSIGDPPGPVPISEVLKHPHIKDRSQPVRPKKGKKS